MSGMILVINAGSSSLKFEVFAIEPSDALARQVRGRVDGVGTQPRLIVHDAKGTALNDEHFAVADVADLPAALSRALAWLRQHFPGVTPVAAGHRVVHGGTAYTTPQLIDDRVLAELDKVVPLVPLHQPHNLEPIRALRQKMPKLPQVACFDTAFHRGHPTLADRMAIPEPLYEEGVRRYGFHGLSYEYIASRLPEVAPEIADRRVIVAHLGSGASLCAMVERKSIESTMGFSALDGLPMGTRPGQLDAGVVLYLVAEKKMQPKAVEHMLYHDCGLKGLSGISSDVRDLLASPDPRAALALDYFTYRLGMVTGSLAAAMGGIDGFVFTAGIGENSPEIRERAARRLAWLGLELDPAANRSGATLISDRRSPVKCYVIPTDEELMIARHTLAVLRGARTPARSVTAA
jgi:acetate kinase